MPLYERLFKYVPTNNHTQLENFLTESLCELLQRLTVADPASAIDFIINVLLSNAVQDSFRKHLDTPKSMSWITQKRIALGDQVGYIDLCLYLGSDVLLAVECKIAAGFTSHVSPNEAEEKSISQLEFYDRWLSSQYPDAALVLLTHFTEAPEYFAEATPTNANLSRYAVPIRQKCQWIQVYEWFSHWRELVHTKTYSDKIVFLNMLAGEFLQFLEERNMAPMPIEKNDIDTLNLFFERDIWKKVRQLMASIRGRVHPQLPQVGSKPSFFPRPDAWERNDILWDWVYCCDQQLQWYVSWGFAGRLGLKHLDITFQSPQVFVLASSDKRSIPLSDDDLRQVTTQGWQIHAATPKLPLRLLRHTSANELAEKDKSFNAEFHGWIEKATTEAASLLELARTRV